MEKKQILSGVFFSKKTLPLKPQDEIRKSWCISGWSFPIRKEEDKK